MNDVAFLAQALIIGLAGWRLAALLSYERGPYNIFVGFREQLGYEHDDNGRPSAWPGGWREVFSCVWCLAIWTSLIMWGLWELEELIVVVWAAATMAILVERWANG